MTGADRTRSTAVVAKFQHLTAVSRPRFWLYLGGPAILGVTYGAETVDDLFALPAVAIVLYFLVPANVSLYGLNDVFDATVDEVNPRKGHREVRYRGHRFVGAAIVVTALGLFLLIPVVNTIAGWYLVGYVVLATAYSAPPLRLKTTPLIDSASNGLYVLPGGAAYAAIAGGHPPALALLGGWLWTMAMHTFSAIPDIDPDEAAGIQTTATLLGETWSYWYCGSLWALAAAAFALLDVRLGALLGIYPLLVAGIARSRVAIDRAYWWYPVINACIGAVITMWGLWVLVHP